MKKINRIIALMMTLVLLTGTYGPALNVYASEAEKTAVSKNAAVTEEETAVSENVADTEDETEASENAAVSEDETKIVTETEEALSSPATETIVALQKFYTFTLIKNDKEMKLGLTDEFKSVLNSGEGVITYTLGGSEYQWHPGDPLLNPGTVYNDGYGTILPITSMEGLFSGCKNVTALDLSKWETGNVTNMNEMFYQCEKLENLLLTESFDTSKVTSMESMFKKCKSLKELDLKSFDTSKVRNMAFMFESCDKMKYLDIRYFDFSSIGYFGTLGAYGTKMMFSSTGNKLGEEKTAVYLNSSEQAELLKRDSYVSDYSYVNLLVWNEKEMPYELLKTFYTYSDKDNGYKVGLTSEFKSKLNNTNNVSLATPGGEYIWHTGDPLPNPVISDKDKYKKGMLSLSEMFKGCEVRSLDLSLFDTSDVIDYSSMFENCTKLTSLDLSSFTASDSTNINKMFLKAADDNGADTYFWVPVASYDTYVKFSHSNATGVNSNKIRFKGDCYTITFDMNGHGESIAPIVYTLGDDLKYPNPVCAGWKLSYWYDKKTGARYYPDHHVATKSSMTLCAKWVYDLNLTENEKEKFYSYNYVAGGYALKLKDEFKNAVNALHGSYEVELDNGSVYVWNAGDPLPDPGSTHLKGDEAVPVFSYSSLFYQYNNVRTLDLSHWDTSNVRNMNNMFSDTSRISYLDISGFNTENVTTMYEMFRYFGNYSGSEPVIRGLEDLNTSNVENMKNMFIYDDLKDLDLSKWDTSNVKTFENMFWCCLELEKVDLSGFTFRDDADLTTMFCNVGANLAAGRYTQVYLKDADEAQKLQAILPACGNHKVKLIAPADPKKLPYEDLEKFYIYNQISLNNYSIELTPEFKAELEKTNGSLSTEENTYTWNAGDPLPNPDPAGGTRMVRSYTGMFKNCTAEKLDLSLFTTENADNFSEMFKNCSNLTAIDLSGFKIDDTDDVSGMFSGTCSNASETVQGTTDSTELADILNNTDKTGIDNDKLVFGIRWSVVFDLGGHGTAIPKKLVNDGETIQAPEQPEETGYSFKGWYADDKFTAEFDFSKPVTSSVTIYAKWLAIYDVSFVMNGHGENINKMSVCDGEFITDLGTPVDETFDFVGWYYDEALTKEFSLTDPIVANTVLYAKWVAKPVMVTVSFLPGEGKGSMESVKFEKGSEYTLPECGFTAPESKIFVKWDKGLPGTKIKVETDMEIKALYISTYAVTVSGGTGSGNYAAGTTVTIKADAPAEGKVFDKWTSEDNVVFSDPSAVTTTFVMPAKAVTVTATYKDNVTEHDHKLKHHDRVEPTEEKEGSIEYWECEDCKKLFSDAAGTKEINLADTVLPKLKDPVNELIEVVSEPVTETINDKNVSIKVRISYPKAVTWTGSRITKSQLEVLSDGAGIAKVNVTGLEEALNGRMKEGTDVSKLFSCSYTISKDKNVGDKASFKVKVKLNASAVKKAKIKGADKKALSAMVKNLNDKLKDFECSFDIAPIKLKDAESVTIKAKLKKGALQVEENGELKGLKSVKVKVRIKGVKKPKTYTYNAKKAAKAFKVTVTDLESKKVELIALEGGGFTGTKGDITVK